MKGRDSSLRSEWHQKSTQIDKNKTGGSQFKLWDSSLRSEWQQKDAQDDKNHVYSFLYKTLILNVVKDIYWVVIDKNVEVISVFLITIFRPFWLEKTKKDWWKSLIINSKIE